MFLIIVKSHILCKLFLFVYEYIVTIIKRYNYDLNILKRYIK